MSLKKFGMIYGAYIGLILVGASWLMSISGLRETAPGTVDFVLSVILIGGIVYSIIQFRDTYLNGFISYIDSFKLGVSISHFFSIIVGLAIFIDYNFIPISKEKIIQQNEVMEKSIKKLKNENQKIKNNETVSLDTISSFYYYTDSLIAKKNIDNPIYNKTHEYFVSNIVLDTETDIIIRNTIIQRNKEGIKNVRLSIKVNKPHYLAFASVLFFIFFGSILTAVISFFVKKSKES